MKTKFRAWDKKEKKMYLVASIDFILEKIEIWINTVKNEYGITSNMRRFSDMELMQYTDLKDSNGVEIYEGDVVEMHFIGPLQRNVLKGIVVFLEGSWLVGNDAEKTAAPLWSETNKVTIIGNIHENSALLEGE